MKEMRNTSYKSWVLPSYNTVLQSVSLDRDKNGNYFRQYWSVIFLITTKGNSMISHHCTPMPRRYIPVLTVILVFFSLYTVSARAASPGDTSSSGSKSWLGGVDSLHKKGETYPEFTRSTIMTKKSISTITVSPDPVTTDKMTISLDAMSAVSVLIRLYTPTGEAVSNLWLGKLHSGINTLTIDVPDSLASGSYLLAVEGDDGKPLIYSAIVRKK